MLEGPRLVEHSSAALREPLHGLPFPSSDRQSSAFTPVNGETPPLPSFRPTEGPRPWRSSSGKSSPGDTITVSTSLHTHGWRPDIREVTAEQNSDSLNKRKRTDDVDDDLHIGTNGDSVPSPKRRQLPNLLDSAIDLTSPDTEVSRRPPGPAPSSREPSPIGTVNRGPPPQASSQTVANLAESAKKFNEGDVDPGPAEESTSPTVPDEEVEQDQVNGQAQDQDDPDGRKRKRLFANRTKTGCHTCRNRKKKCDERKPTCANCERGHFTCHGYGPKPPGFKVTASNRVPPPLQPSTKQFHPEQQYPPNQQGPTSYWQQPDAGKSYSHWGGGRVADDPKTFNNRDNWQQVGWRTELPPPLPQGQPQPQPLPLPPPQPQHQPPPQPQHQPQHQPQPQPSFYPDHAYGPPPPAPHHNAPYPHNNIPLPPPPTHVMDPYGPPLGFHPYSQHPPPPPSVMSHLSGSSSHTAGRNGYSYPLSEKDKMLRGMPYLHFTDPGLLRERERCTQAVIRYNEGAIPDKNISINQRGEWFSQILEPRKRPQTDQKEHHGPQGEIGDYSIVDTPFRCDYGYHIHLGKEVVISAECYLQDGGGIHIGDRVIIGTRTQLLTMTASVDANVRGGSQGRCKAGRILIDDDVFIGAGVIVLPYVTIGKGAVVGAGSVVTRDVLPNTVVAGSPAKHIRRIENNADHHDHPTLDRQEDLVVKAMQDYVNCGYKTRSPKLI